MPRRPWARGGRAAALEYVAGHALAGDQLLRDSTVDQMRMTNRHVSRVRSTAVVGCGGCGAVTCGAG